MHYRLRGIAATLLDGIDRLCACLAAGCRWLSDLAEDAAWKLRR